MRNRDLKRGGEQGVWLRSLRVANGLHQSDLADRLGVSRSQIAFYEAGGEIPQHIRAKLQAEYPNQAAALDQGTSQYGSPVVTQVRHVRPLQSEPLPQVLDHGLRWLGAIPHLGTFEEAHERALQGGYTVFTAPQLSAVGETVSEIARPAFNLLPHDYAVWSHSAIPQIGQICLIEDERSNRLDFAVTRFHEASPWLFVSSEGDAEPFTEARIVGRLVGVYRREQHGARYWARFSGFRPEDLGND